MHTSKSDSNRSFRCYHTRKLSRELLHFENLVGNRGQQAAEDVPGVTTVSYRGHDYDIGSDRRQVLSLLLSTYETAMAKNLALIEAQDELRRLNRDLEARVQQ